MGTEEAEIISQMRRFAEAWNSGDVQKAASFFSDDAVRVGAFGDRQQGRPAIEAAMERVLHGAMLGAHLTQEPGEVRLLTRELAVWDGAIAIVPPGGGGAVVRGHVVQVMKKSGNRWLILEAHPKFFPPSQTLR